MTIDPMAQLEAMMGNVPGGSYMLAMLRNNPEAMRALSTLDHNDPRSMEKGMRILLGAFGIQGPQADAMLAQTMQMMQDPDALAKMQGMMPGMGMPGMGAGRPPASGAGSTPVEVTAERVATPPPPSRPKGPAWVGAVPEVERMLDEGNDRRAFERMTTVLDDPAVEAYDPRNPDHEELTDLMALYARAAKSQGRQVALRFASLYQRLAMSKGIAEFTPPDANPAFSVWCLQVTG